MQVDLLSLVPKWFHEVAEFVELLKSEEAILAELESDIGRVRANNYILTCDAQTLALHEKRLGMTNFYGEDLEYRRKRIMERYNLRVPFSSQYLDKKLEDLYGEGNYSFTIRPQLSRLLVDVKSDMYNALDVLYDMLLDIVPAHIEIKARQDVTNEIYFNSNIAIILSNTKYQTI